MPNVLRPLLLDLLDGLPVRSPYSFVFRFWIFVPALLRLALLGPRAWDIVQRHAETAVYLSQRKRWVLEHLLWLAKVIWRTPGGKATVLNVCLGFLAPFILARFSFSSERFGWETWEDTPTWCILVLLSVSGSTLWLQYSFVVQTRRKLELLDEILVKLGKNKKRIDWSLKLRDRLHETAQRGEEKEAGLFAQLKAALARSALRHYDTRLRSEVEQKLEDFDSASFLRNSATFAVIMNFGPPAVLRILVWTHEWSFVLFIAVLGAGLRYLHQQKRGEQTLLGVLFARFREADEFSDEPLSQQQQEQEQEEPDSGGEGPVGAKSN